MKLVRIGDTFTLSTDFRIKEFDLDAGFALCVMYQTISTGVDTSFIGEVEIYLPLSFPAFRLGPSPYDTFIHPTLLNPSMRSFCTYTDEGNKRVYVPKIQIHGTLYEKELYTKGISLVRADDSIDVHILESPVGDQKDAGVWLSKWLLEKKLFTAAYYQGKAVHFAVSSNAHEDVPEIVEEVAINNLFLKGKRKLQVWLDFGNGCQFYADYSILLLV